MKMFKELSYVSDIAMQILPFLRKERWKKNLGLQGWKYPHPITPMTSVHLLHIKLGKKSFLFSLAYFWIPVLRTEVGDTCLAVVTAAPPGDPEPALATVASPALLVSSAQWLFQYTRPATSLSAGKPLSCFLPSVREVMFPKFSVLISAIFSITRICLDSLSRRSLVTNGVLLENTICWWRQMGRDKKNSLNQKENQTQKNQKNSETPAVKWQINCLEPQDLLKIFFTLGVFFHPSWYASLFVATFISNFWLTHSTKLKKPITTRLKVRQEY